MPGRERRGGELSHGNGGPRGTRWQRNKARLGAQAGGHGSSNESRFLLFPTFKLEAGANEGVAAEVEDAGAVGHADALGGEVNEEPDAVGPGRLDADVVDDRQTVSVPVLP